MKRHRQSVENNSNIWLYIAFGLLVLVCFLFIGFKLMWKTEPDLRISYASTEYMNTQTFNDTIGEVELLLRDANGDGQQKAGVEAYYSKDTAEVLKKLEQYIESDSYDIYISTKTACSFDNSMSGSVYELTKNKDYAKTSIRISLSYLTTEEEITYFLEIFKPIKVATPKIITNKINLINTICLSFQNINLIFIL